MAADLSKLPRDAALGLGEEPRLGEEPQERQSAAAQRTQRDTGPPPGLSFQLPRLCL